MILTAVFTVVKSCRKSTVSRGHEGGGDTAPGKRLRMLRSDKIFSQDSSFALPPKPKRAHGFSEKIVIVRHPGFPKMRSEDRGGSE